MITFLLRRIIFACFAMIGATFITFGLSRAAGDPRYLYAQEGGYGITPERWDELGREMGLDNHSYGNTQFGLGIFLKAIGKIAFLTGRMCLERSWIGYPQHLNLR